MFCGSREEWKQSLIQLIENAELRKCMGDSAYDAVLSECTSTDLEEDIQQIFR